MLYDTSSGISRMHTSVLLQSLEILDFFQYEIISERRADGVFYSQAFPVHAASMAYAAVSVTLYYINNHMLVTRCGVIIRN
jgi:hypothetical protein